MRILFVTGSRNWTDQGAIAEVFNRFQPEMLIEGGAPGADRLAAEEGRARWLDVREYVADWATHGKAAGVIRNQVMLDDLVELRSHGHEIRCVAFHADLEASKGTKDMVARLVANHFPYELVE